MANTPGQGRNVKGTNEWERDDDERFQRTKTTYAEVKTRPNRHERRKAIALKRRGLL